MDKPVLRIFISSTAVDLLGYREKVRDAILRLEHLPIAMETFSARSGQPVAECTAMSAEADAVICVVAHRYGYVPPVELGGDGERSITWLEVEAGPACSGGERNEKRSCLPRDIALRPRGYHNGASRFSKRY